MTDSEGEVWKTVEALNRCWTEGRPQDLRAYFHSRMVAITPADRLPLVGAEVCLAGWTQYAQTVKILSWKTRDSRVTVFGETAVVTYLYEMECELDGRPFRPQGRDMMVLIKEDDRWRVIADQFSPYPSDPQA